MPCPTHPAWHAGTGSSTPDTHGRHATACTARPAPTRNLRPSNNRRCAAANAAAALRARLAVVDVDTLPGRAGTPSGAAGLPRSNVITGGGGGVIMHADDRRASAPMVGTTGRVQGCL